MTRVLPIEREQLEEVGRFLHANLNPRISASDWTRSLTFRWATDPPNHGMRLLDGDRLVGVFCAIYSDQWIDGKLERVCNPHSWCVLEDFRSSSISLVLPLLKQPGYHFTMFTPNPKVAQIFQGLKFRNLDDRLLVFPNLPRLLPRGASQFVVGHDGPIETKLSGEDARAYAEHRSIPWLRFAAFGDGTQSCLVVYKRARWKRMPCARILHVSNPALFETRGGLVRHHLLVREGMPVSRIEARFLLSAPRFSYRLQRTQPKLVLSKSLRDGAVSDLYSELTALDV